MSVRVSIAIVAILFCVAAACGSSGPATGSALAVGASMRFGLAPLRPGTQLGLLDVDLVNRSDSPVTLESVSGLGRGLGTVIRVVQVMIAPARGNGSKDVPGGAYETDPPVWYAGEGVCNRQLLVPLRGFRLPPGGLARIWIVVQAARAGRFAVTGHLVRYSQGGTRYQQVVPTGYHGLVSPAAPFIPVSGAEARCLKIMKSGLLPGQHAAIHSPSGPRPSPSHCASASKPSAARRQRRPTRGESSAELDRSLTMWRRLRATT